MLLLIFMIVIIVIVVPQCDSIPFSTISSWRITKNTSIFISLHQLLNKDEDDSKPWIIIPILNTFSFVIVKANSVLHRLYCIPCPFDTDHNVPQYTAMLVNFGFRIPPAVRTQRNLRYAHVAVAIVVRRE